MTRYWTFDEKISQSVRQSSRVRICLSLSSGRGRGKTSAYLSEAIGNPNTNPSGSSIICAHAVPVDVVDVGIVRCFFVDVRIVSVRVGRLLLVLKARARTARRDQSTARTRARAEVRHSLSRGSDLQRCENKHKRKPAAEFVAVVSTRARRNQCVFESNTFHVLFFFCLNVILNGSILTRKVSFSSLTLFLASARERRVELGENVRARRRRGSDSDWREERESL